MMNFMEAGDVINREAIRLQALIDAAAAITSLGSIQQAADEATKRRNEMSAEVDSLTTQLSVLKPQVADATGKAELLVNAAQAQADKIVADANAAAAAAAQIHMDKAVADVQVKMQSTVDASNQAVANAQVQLDDLVEKIATLEADAADRYMAIDKLAADKDALEAALSALKSKFA